MSEASRVEAVMSAWDLEEAARIADGRNCSRCRQYIHFEGCGGPRECHACRSLSQARSVRHEKFIRCPACGGEREADIRDARECIAEGVRTFTETCRRCEQEFEVEVSVQVTFESPRRN